MEGISHRLKESETENKMNERKKWGTIAAVLIFGGFLLIGLWMLWGKNPPASAPVGPESSASGTEAPGDTPPDNGGSYRVQVLWEDDRQPATGTSVTLICEKSREGNKTVFSAPQELKTDLSGLASFQLPEGVALVKIAASRAYAFAQSTTATVTATQETTLLLKKAYECFGTVYAVNDSGTTVPVQGAIVSVSGQKDFRTPPDAKGAAAPGKGVISDAQGKFHMVSPVPQVLLQASKGVLTAPLLEKDRIPKTLRHEALNGPYDLVLEKGCSLLVSVFRKDTMEGIPDARVDVEGMNPEKPFQTNKDGECEIQGLPQGMALVSVSADAYARDFARVALSPKEGNMVVFTLAPAGQIKVFTVDEKDQPVGGVRVRLNIQETGQQIEEIVTNGAGYGELNQVPAQVPLWLKPVRADRYHFNSLGIVCDMAGDIEEVKLVCKPSDPRPEGVYWVKGRVVDVENRQPVPGLTVQARDDKKTTTNEKGEFCLQGLEGPQGEGLLFWGKGYKTVFKDFVPVNTSLEVEISHSTSLLHGKVVDVKTNEPIPSFSILQMWPPDEENSSCQKIFSPDGTFEVENFYPEDMKYIEPPITLKADGYEAMTRRLSSNSTENTREILFALTPINKATGKVVDAETHEPIPGAQVGYNEGLKHKNMYLKIGYEIFGQTDEKGEFALDVSSNPGTFFALADGYAPKAQTVSSEKDFPLEIPLEKSSILKVRFHQADSSPMVAGIATVVKVQPQDKGPDLTLWYDKNEEEKPNTIVWRSLPSGKGTVKILVSSDANQNKSFIGNYYDGEGTLPLEWCSKEMANGWEFLNPGFINWGDKPYFWTEVISSVEVLAGRETVVEIPADSSVSGRLTHKGSPVQGLVLLENRMEGAVYRYMAFTTPDGVYQFPAIASGNYTVFVGAREDTEKSLNTECSAPYRENLNISGTTRKDFELDGVLGHKVTGKIRRDTLPLAGYDVVEVPFGSLRLEQIAEVSGGTQTSDKNGISRFWPDGSFSLKGHFRGTYKLTLEGRSGTFLSLSEPLVLDNLNGDQDLGEIDTQAKGPFSLSVSILQADYLEDVKQYAQVFVEKISPPQFKRYTNFSSQGTATLSDLLPGDYRIRLTGLGNNYDTDFAPPRTLTIQENVSLQYDARELIKNQEQTRK
jgi:hypothetical protein